MLTSVHAAAGVDLSSPALVSATGKRVATTERKLGAWLFPYYTTGTSWVTRGPSGWVSGYLPGELWTSYALNGDTWFRDHAISREAPLGRSLPTSSSIDIGQRYFYSYALGYRLTGKPSFRTYALKAATAQAQRYNPAVGALRSTADTSTYEVIVDDLMNIQLLVWGANNGGPAQWKAIAHTHALTTARDFIRADGSTYHEVSYDATTGAVISKGTIQGYNDDSMWSRGQAWAISGFTAAYEASRDATLLAAARTVADRYLADLPADMVPYWDFRDPAIPSAPRDSSAAAIAASGLLDLASVDPDPANQARYESAARDTLTSLASPSYFSSGTVPAILMHGTTYYWNPTTVDCGQSFGDYFFLDALLRLRAFPTTMTPLPVRRAFASSGKPRAALDRIGSTAWTSKGKQWLDLDLGARRTVHAVGVTVRYGSSRAAPFKVYTSFDRKHWKRVDSACSSGATAKMETFTFTRTRTRFVRLAVSGTSRSTTNGICELRVY